MRNEPHLELDTLNDRLLRESSPGVERSGSTPPRSGSHKHDPQLNPEGPISNNPSFWQKGLLLAVAVALSAPVIALVACAPRISASIPDLGCRPDGTFALPGTNSVWDRSQFLSINVQVNSEPWTFARAKAVDICWDLLVGRGLQVLLSVVCLHIFGNALRRLMEDEEVPFRTYGAVHFSPGSFSSSFPIFAALRPPTRRASNTGSVREQVHSRRRLPFARFPLVLIGLLTLFVTALPTLLSAATGYTSEAYPVLSYYNSFKNAYTAEANRTSIACGGVDYMANGLLPAWGTTHDIMRASYTTNYTVVSYAEVITYQSNLLDYYYKYKSAYDALATDPKCTHVNTTADCAATNISSVLAIPYDDPVTLGPPLLNIRVYAPFNGTDWTKGAPYQATGANPPAAWMCGGGLVFTTDFSQDMNSGNVTATCSGGSVSGIEGESYHWGFSFYMTLISCVLSFAAALAFYGLWWYSSAERAGTWRVESPSPLRAAADIIQQARKLYGDEAVDGTWGEKEMRRRIYGGERGMRMPRYKDTAAASAGVDLP